MAPRTGKDRRKRGGGRLHEQFIKRRGEIRGRQHCPNAGAESLFHNALFPGTQRFLWVAQEGRVSFLSFRQAGSLTGL